MKRSTILNVCFYGTVLSVGAAILIKTIRSAGDAVGGDSLVLMSPIFFSMAAKKGSGRFGRAAVGVALIGLVFGVGALFAVLQSGAKP
jgi:hypothetical protein